MKQMVKISVYLDCTIMLALYMYSMEQQTPQAPSSSTSSAAREVGRKIEKDMLELHEYEYQQHLLLKCLCNVLRSG